MMMWVTVGPWPESTREAVAVARAGDEVLVE
jgi:hypothetical protein